MNDDKLFFTPEDFKTWERYESPNDTYPTVTQWCAIQANAKVQPILEQLKELETTKKVWDEVQFEPWGAAIIASEARVEELGERVEELEERNKKLRERLKSAEEALRFYADFETFRQPTWKNWSSNFEPILLDIKRYAREYFEKWEEK